MDHVLDPQRAEYYFLFLLQCVTQPFWKMSFLVLIASLLSFSHPSYFLGFFFFSLMSLCEVVCICFEPPVWYFWIIFMPPAKVFHSFTTSSFLLNLPGLILSRRVLIFSFYVALWGGYMLSVSILLSSKQHYEPQQLHTAQEQAKSWFSY